MASDYAELSRRIKQAGLLRRRPAYYAAKSASTAVLLAAGWTAFFLLGDSWWQLVTAVFLAFAFTQIAFLGHDAGHRQICGTRRANGLLGLVLGNLLIGVSYTTCWDAYSGARATMRNRDPAGGDGHQLSCRARPVLGDHLPRWQAFGREQGTKQRLWVSIEREEEPDSWAARPFMIAGMSVGCRKVGGHGWIHPGSSGSDLPELPTGRD
jgi:hypothetical protein